MFRKYGIRTGFFGLLSLLTAGPQVHANLTDGDTPQSTTPETFDLPMLLEAPIVKNVPMSPKLQQALQNALKSSDEEKMKNGIFTIGPNGELQYIGNKTEFDKIREELIRLKTEKNHAGSPSKLSNCA